MKNPTILLSSALLCLTLAAQVANADTVHTVHFAKGASSATVKGVVIGNNSEDYDLRAAQGQTITVKLSAKSTLIYFNVLKKGSDEALYVGSSNSKTSWSGKLPTDGDYTVRVYTMGKGKEAGHTTPFSLNIAIK
jgi:hypothetical protein